jgi:SAM-dependent methyltransferase
MTADSHTPRTFSPAAERNREAVAAQLRLILASDDSAATATVPENPRVSVSPTDSPRHLLEIASGTGQHAAFCAPTLPGWLWWPSDLSADRLASIADWCADVPSVQTPLLLDVLQPTPWPGVPPQLDAIYCANLLHIAPWACCAGLMQGAAGHLKSGGLLLIYGPFVVPGQTTAASNLAFDADLRSQDPAWGLRSLSEVLAAAAVHRLGLWQQITMPANNLLLVLGRQG